MNAPSRRRARPSSPPAQTDLFVARKALPEGFRYHQDILSAEEEEALARELGALPCSRSTFMDTWLTARW
jgi:hypothetical protein